MQSNFVRALALVSVAPFLSVVAAPDAFVGPQATQPACTYTCPPVDLKGNQLDVDDSTISGDALTCFYGDASLALGCAYSIQDGAFRFGTSSDTDSDSCPQLAVADSGSECPALPEDGATKSSIDIMRQMTSMHRLSRRERYELQRKREEIEDEEDCESDPDDEPSTGKRDVDDEDEDEKDEADCDDSEGEPTLYTRGDDEDEDDDDEEEEEENCDLEDEGPLNKRGDEEDEEEEECDEEN